MIMLIARILNTNKSIQFSSCQQFWRNRQYGTGNDIRSFHSDTVGLKGTYVILLSFRINVTKLVFRKHRADWLGDKNVCWRVLGFNLKCVTYCLDRPVCPALQKRPWPPSPFCNALFTIRVHIHTLFSGTWNNDIESTSLSNITINQHISKAGK